MKKTLDAAAEICPSCWHSLVCACPVIIYGCDACSRIGCQHVVVIDPDSLGTISRCVIGGCAKRKTERKTKTKARVHA